MPVVSHILSRVKKGKKKKKKGKKGRHSYGSREKKKECPSPDEKRRKPEKKKKLVPECPAGRKGKIPWDRKKENPDKEQNHELTLGSC